MAGTTVRDDDAVNTCLRDALADAGVHAGRDAVNAVMGIPKPLAIAAVLRGNRPAQEPTPELISRIHENFLGRMIRFYQTDPRVGEMPGAAATFRQLRQAGIKVGLDTGFSRPIVNAILDRLVWSPTGLLDTTVASDEVPRGRPHPDLLFEAMRRTGITDVQAVAKVGDTPSDLQEGAAAGCALVVGVTNGTHTRAQLESHPHTHLIASLFELPALLLAARD
jgi:phosphonatase-like hydrolase